MSCRRALTLLLAVAPAALSAEVDFGAPPTFAYGPKRVQPAIRYFKHWAEGELAQKLAQHDATAGTAVAPSTAQEVVALLRHHQLITCQEHHDLPVTFELHHSEVDERGVHHAILIEGTGRLQYVASLGGRILTADPPACSPRKPSSVLTTVQRRLGLGSGTSFKEPLEFGHKNSTLGEKDELLHPETDPLVKDCVALFERTASERCHKNLTAKVLSASLEIVDGILVRVHAKIINVTQEVHHRIWCRFEATGRAKALNAVRHEDKDEILPEESQGLVASVIMHLDICQSGDESTEKPQTVKALKLFEIHGTGELSKMKGHKHVYDGLPRWLGSLQMKAEAAPPPASFHLKELAPMCFPDQIIRDQGQCGSCWAFASATAMMTTLCVRGLGNHTIVNGSRHEVSVQRIISCNKYDFGCEGGHALASADSFETSRMATDAAVPYKCGSGNSLSHFTEASVDCEATPWGGDSSTCAPDHMNGAWKFMSLKYAQGDQEMKDGLLAGYSMYATFYVYDNFFSLSREIYNTTAGATKVGGHAVALIGYGMDKTMPYWTLQNSWSNGWGDNGYFRFLRGHNLASIEDFAVMFEGFPAGSGPPADPTKADPANHDVANITQEDVINEIMAHKEGIAGAGLAFILLLVGCCCCCCSCMGKAYNQVPTQ